MSSPNLPQGEGEKSYCKRFAQSAGPLFRQCGRCSFFRMEYRLEYMFMNLVYLLGSPLATWGHPGTLFGCLGTIFATLWAHIKRSFAVQNVPSRPRCPNKHHPEFPLYITFWVSKITNSRAQRHPKQGEILRSSTSLNYGRVFQNQAFQLLR